MAAAARDPVNFINNLPEPITIDEIQRLPELFLPIKKIADSKSENWMFILTGSANILTIPKISDSLAGRMIIHTLCPLSQGEIRNKDGTTFSLDSSKLRPVLENFVVMELMKQKAWSDNQPKLYHFRTQAGKEVDMMLDGKNKKIIGIEVKASASVKPDDFAGLEKPASIAGDDFAKGFVLYLGAQIIPFGKNLFAMPLQILWS